VASNFAVVANVASAATSSAQIVYVSGTGTGSGSLFYNQNGATAGYGTGAQFAAIVGTPTLAASDFIVTV
jgi:hypothetical protein